MLDMYTLKLLREILIVVLWLKKQKVSSEILTLQLHTHPGFFLR